MFPYFLRPFCIGQLNMTISVEKKPQETEIKLFKIWDGEYMEKGKSLDKISCVQDLSYADCTCSFRIMLFFQC